MGDRINGGSVCIVGGNTNKTKIQYLTHTWNPLAMHCTRISEGCRNCWHLAMAKRLAKNPMIDETVRRIYSGEFKTACLDEEELRAPFHCRKPGRIGVQFMGDLFHESVPSRLIEEVFWIMSECHVEENGQYKYDFFILTKRPERMQEFLKWDGWTESAWPCVWLGVSIEDQKTADERIPILLQIPAVHRWLSVEPLLGPVDLSPWLSPCGYYCDHDEDGGGHRPDRSKIDWVVCGGETGPGARPVYPDWVRSLRDQCQAANVPFFFKGWGEWRPYFANEEKPIRRCPAHKGWKEWNGGIVSIRVGHKKSGRLLDGRSWDEIPICKV